MPKNEEYHIKPSDNDEKPFDKLYNPTVIENYPGALGAPFSPRQAKDRYVTYNKTNEQDY